MKRSSLSILGILTAALLIEAVVAYGEKPDAPAQAKEPADPAVERTRKQVRLLDDLYKSSIVLITENYVTEESDLAAGSAFQALFKAMKDKGWHEVRLLDATGEPYDDENLPKDEFEKQAVEKLKAGTPYVDEIIEKDGKRYLRAATPIPVVMQKCTLCHENYKSVPEGKPIGALGYTIEIE
jgi:hypothetical protein